MLQRTAFSAITTRSRHGGGSSWASSAGFIASPTPPNPSNQASRAKSKAPGAAGPGGGSSKATTRIGEPGPNGAPCGETSRTRRGN